MRLVRYSSAEVYVCQIYGDNLDRDNETSAQPQHIVMGAARRDPRGGEEPMELDKAV